MAAPVAAASSDAAACARPRAHQTWTPLIVALLLIAYYALALTASRSKSPTFDEIVHITAGYNAWTNHDQRFDPGNGDFVKRWATLPLLISRPAFPPRDGDDWKNAEFFRVSRQFMFGIGNDPDAILLQTRAMVGLLGVALGLLVYACSRSLFGRSGGLVSLVAFVLCPHMLAYGAIVATDLTLSLALLASTWFAWRLLHVVSWLNLIGSLLAFCVLVVSKMSAVLIVPIAAVLIVARIFNRDPWIWCLRSGHALTHRPRQLIGLGALIVVHALAGWGAIWATFDFKYAARGEPANTELRLMRSEGADVKGVINTVATFCHEHHLLPEGFLKGMEELVGISKRRPSFMNGHWKAGGQAMFFPYAFWVKTPPALLVLVSAGIAGWIWLRRRRRGDACERPNSSMGPRPSVPGFYQAIPFLALAVIYGAVAMRQDVNIGHRHILPLYPVLYIFAGSIALLLAVRRTAVIIVIAAVLGWYTTDSFAVRPDYLAYFSPVAGGPSQGYRRLADSSLDWGQDLPGLGRWLAEHNPDDGEPVFFSYFGTGDPDHYGIKSKRLPGFPEWRDFPVFAYTPGYYAISATMLQQLYATTFGPWCRLYEEEYQIRVQRLGLTPENTKDTSALAATLLTHPTDVWEPNYGRFEQLEFGRLCSWLRATGRVPEAQVGHSILIWKLSAADLHDALWAPPHELYEHPASDP